MASPNFNCITVPRISSIVRDARLRTVFERAERDIPPEALAVEPEHAPVLTGGAVRELAEA